MVKYRRKEEDRWIKGGSKVYTVGVTEVLFCRSKAIEKRLRQKSDITKRLSFVSKSDIAASKNFLSILRWLRTT